MSIQKKEYELSIWHETLDENGIVSETKDLIIAAHDMTYLGAAKNLILETKLNGTHELSFEMPDKFFDSLKGDYIHNEFVDAIFNESKLKLHYRGDWYEFVIKNVSDTKHFKSYMKKYTCTDSFVEELSRNGYGITFDTELHNNVDEMGTLSRIILDDSAWEYAPEHNWGDFTEYTEEKLLKVPLRMFNELEGVKLDFTLAAPEKIENAFTHEKRPIELGDDLAAADIEHDRPGYFWDDKNHNNPLMKEKLSGAAIRNDGYIYIPYSQIQFCYETTSTDDVITATEEPCYFVENGKKLSYAIAPRTIDPTGLIEFLAIPEDAQVEIDEAGLIVSKEFTYVMTVEQWNKNVKSKYYYKFLPEKKEKSFTAISRDLNFEELACGNKAIGYEGYLDKIGETEVMYGKKISITNRTEPNVTEEIDKFVTVYNNDSEDYNSLYEEHEKWRGDNKGYRVCSKIDTRQVIPQLARNLFQNGTQIKSVDGWEPQKTYISTDGNSVQPIAIRYYAPAVESSTTLSDEELDSLTETNLEGQIIVDMSGAAGTKKNKNDEDIPAWADNDGNVDDAYHTVLNFGAIGQDEELSNTQIYCFGLSVAAASKTLNGTRSIYSIIKDSLDLANMSLVLGEGGAEAGGTDGSGSYTITQPVEFAFSDIAANSQVDSEGYKTFYFLFKLKNTIKHPYLAIRNKSADVFVISACRLFKAYTKGKDFFDEAKYRYSGRDLFSQDLLTSSTENYQRSTAYGQDEISKMILFETDIMAGDTYQYERYFIQQGTTDDFICDTFGKREFLGVTNKAIFDSEKYTEENCEVNTKYVDLTKCEYYCGDKQNATFDCNYGGEHVCLYQKYGYCPYLFQSEKHCRKIRTLKGEKSNRFNLTQELSKVFEMYPIYHINHDSRGKTETQQIDDNTVMKKQVFYIKEKGVENKLGFRYEKNLSSISRTLKSDTIVTKLYVSDVDSEISKTGLCSIKTAEDNVSKDSFIINLDYYTKKDLLNKDMVNADLYGTSEGSIGYLQRLGFLNGEYDKLNNAIINLQDSSTTELEANLEVNLNGIDSAKKNINRLRKEKSSYFGSIKEDEIIKLDENSTYISYCTKINELQGTLRGLVYDTFISEKGGKYRAFDHDYNTKTEAINAALHELNGTFTSAAIIKDSDIYKKHTYSSGMLGQFNTEMLQIASWKKSRASYLKKINALSLSFFHKYEPFLKEGTWSDSNYVTDNAYYFGALEVAKKGSIPKVEYDISVVDLYNLPEYEDYRFDIADTTYVEDIGMFGIDKITGLPKRLKVLISGITYNLDEPQKNSIKVQNFTTQFEDLFQQVTASVQSLSFNENIYMRASSFAANKVIKNESLQGALDTNDLTLLQTEEKNIEIDKTGTAGSDINNHNNKYKLTGEGLFFSNNGGETWNTGVGPSGINADYIKAGTLDAGKVRIVDGDYAYFLWDKEGIFAYREPTDGAALNDFALYNRYGLSLVEKGKIRLRAGYAYSGKNAEGSISAEEGLGDQIGFFLYDNKGNPIFATQTGDTDSAAIALKGEIFVTDSQIEREDTISTTYKYKGDCYELQTTSSATGFVRNNYITNFASSITDILNSTELTITIKDDAFALNNLAEFILYAVQTLENQIDLTSKTIIIRDSAAQLCSITNLAITADATESWGSDSYHHLTISFDYVLLNDASTSYSESLPSYIYFRAKDGIDFTKCPIGWYYKKMGSGTTSSSIVPHSARSYITDKKLLHQSFVAVIDGIETALTGYFDGTKFFYTEQEIIQTTHQNANQSTVLFLNNKLSNTLSNENERLICCATKNDDINNTPGNQRNGTTNIFSILKNGFLYMGGNIKDINDNNINAPAEIPDEIKVDGEFLRISMDKSNNWGMYLRFDSFYDLESGNNLFDTINEKIAEMKLIRHKHEIKQFNAKVDNVDNQSKQYIYLPDKISRESFDRIFNTGSIKDILKAMLYGGVACGIPFSRRGLLMNEEYEYECSNSYTEYSGGANDGQSSGTDSGTGLLPNPYV